MSSIVGCRHGLCESPLEGPRAGLGSSLRGASSISWVLSGMVLAGSIPLVHAADLHLEWILPLLSGGLLSSTCHVFCEWIQGPRCAKITAHDLEKVVGQAQRSCCEARDHLGVTSTTTTTTTLAPHPSMDVGAFWWWFKLALLLGFMLACIFVCMGIVLVRYLIGSNPGGRAPHPIAHFPAMGDLPAALPAPVPVSDEARKWKDQLDWQKREVAQAQVELVRRQRLTLPVAE